MFHGLDVNKPQSIFKYLPLLSFTESYIYQVHNRLLLFNSGTFFIYSSQIFFVKKCWVPKIGSTVCVLKEKIYTDRVPQARWKACL